MRMIRCIELLAGLLVGINAISVLAADVPPAGSVTEPASAAIPEIGTEVVITAPEPRYVAPTTRDRIGRIWAPVYINDKGPFRLVLDTGASSSAIIAQVAESLGIAPDPSHTVNLQGATGNVIVPTIRVDSLEMGELVLNGKKLPIVPDALGGAEGILGSEGLSDKRIRIDFRHDLITITRSRGQRADDGFYVVPFVLMRGRLITVNTLVGNQRVKAVIDTGGQTTLANLALRDALQRQRLKVGPTIDTIVGATLDEEQGEGYPMPSIHMGSIVIRVSSVTFSDLHIFKHWGLIGEPALMIGMDALGLLDTLIIDYRRRELQIKMRS